MTVRLAALCIEANDPARLAAFWAGVLQRDVRDDLVLPAPDGTGFAIRFVPTDRPKTEPNQMHPDLTSTSPEDQEATVERVLGLGGSHLDVGQRPEEGHVVLADPEGNELCVIEPGNRFLAGCGPLGCLASDGTRTVGLFWSEALGWPLVWDQGEETAVQSPAGGPKISWGGPPVRTKTQHNRWHLELDAGESPRSVAESLRSAAESLRSAGEPLGDVGRSVRGALGLSGTTPRRP